MTPEAIISKLGLQAHPEGGWYAEVHRSECRVSVDDGRQRHAGTAIYYLLKAGEKSAWHQVDSDEQWIFLDGAPLKLHRAKANGVQVETLCLCAIESAIKGAIESEQTTPMATILAGEWQAARSTGDWSLVACTVMPGFDFADFRMLTAEGPDLPEV